MMSRRFALTAALLAPLLATPLTAQFQQYTNPGGNEDADRGSLQERLERAIQEARWRTGRWYLDPWLGIRDAAYLDNVGGSSGEDPISDFLISVGAGLNLYRPIGSATTFAAFVLPEYVWWRKLAGRRRLNGRYGVGLFSDLGRTSLELSATRRDSASYFSAELEEPINSRLDRGQAEIEVQLFGGLSVFAGGSIRRFEYPGADDTVAEVRLLERDEEIVEGGLRFPLFAALELGLGIESSQVDFTSPGVALPDRSNSGDSPFAELEYDGSRLFFTTQLTVRDLEAAPGAAFPRYRGTTGSTSASFRLAGRSELELFADRNVVYSLRPDWAYYEDTSYGIQLDLGLSSIASVALYVSTGDLDYVATLVNGPLRRDQFDTFGGDLQMLLGPFEVTVGARRTEYDSNLPAFDRSITVFRSSVSLSGSSLSPWS